MGSWSVDGKTRAGILALLAFGCAGLIGELVLLEHYEKMDIDMQRLIPLRKLYWPA